MKPKIAVLYHFYYPDDVVSARHFQDLCEDLAELGWDVEVWPSNRSCRNASSNYESKEIYQDVQIDRVWRPDFSQGSAFGRIANSLWMISAWCWRWAFYSGMRPQVVLIGTDPVLGLLSAIGIRVLHSKVKIVHWCFDLYPEAAVADGKIKENGFAHRFLKLLMAQAYRACDLIVDLGACMRRRLSQYSSRALHETLTPWAFYEPPAVQPPDHKERSNLFGEAVLGILYAGNFGLAHSADLVMKLAAAVKKDGIQFCFSVRGNAGKNLREYCAANQSPIRFADFISEDKLEMRLEAADIHVVSLKENWTGTVVPSKFFGAIAAGRPVIFEGSQESAIAEWIHQHQLGWVLNSETFNSVAASLMHLSKNPTELKALQHHCRAVYQRFFSRSVMMQRWDSCFAKITALDCL